MHESVKSCKLLKFYYFFLRSSIFLECDKTRCRGPIRYYEDLQCKPIFENENDCCAIRYDCSHLENRSLDKCYANGHGYNVGESLRSEDKWHACAVYCQCIKTENDRA